MLVKEEYLLLNMVQTLMEIALKNVKLSKNQRQVFDVNATITKYDGFWHFMHDFNYILIHHDVAMQFVTQSQWANFVKFLSFLQACHTTIRADSDDDSWHHALLLEVRTIPKWIRNWMDALHANTLQYGYAYTMQHVVQYSFETIVQALQQVLAFENFKQCSPILSNTEIADTVAPYDGELYVPIIHANMYYGPFSFQLPLHRLLAAWVQFLTCNAPPTGSNCTRDILNMIQQAISSSNNKQVPAASHHEPHIYFLQCLCEQPLRAHVLRYHVRRSMHIY